MARWGLAFKPKVDKCVGNSQARRKSCSGGQSPRNDVSKHALPASPRFGSRSEIASSSPRSSVASTSERSQQKMANVNFRRSSNLETTQTEGRRTSESHVGKPTPEVAKNTECEVDKQAAIEPEAEWARKQPLQCASRDCDSCASSCWKSQVMPRFGMENPAGDNVVNTPSSLNETSSIGALDVDATNPEPSPEPSDQGDTDTTKQSGLGHTCMKDDSNFFSWTTALGGKLDDLCERTLALEKELREHCSDVATDAEPNYMNEESFPDSASAVDFMPEPCKDGALIPGPVDGAVEKELNSLRNCVSGMQANFGELRAMVQQLGGELRNFQQSRRREESASQSAIVLVFPNSTPSLKQVVRVVEPPSLPVQAKHQMQPCMSPGPAMGTQASVTTSSSVQHPPLPPGALCPPHQAVGATNLNLSLRRLSGTPASPRKPQAPVRSPVQRFASMPAAYCRPSDASMPSIATTQQQLFWNRTTDIRNIQQRSPLQVS